jgi:hypothetical protein
MCLKIEETSSKELQSVESREWQTSGIGATWCRLDCKSAYLISEKNLAMHPA